MDVDPALAVGARLLGAEEELLVVLLRRGRAVLQHRAHRGVAVDVRVVALEVALLRVARGDLVEDVHELRVLLAGGRAVGAVEDVGLGDVLEAGAHERDLDGVLDLLDVGDLVGVLLVDDRVDRIAEALGLLGALVPGRLHRAGDGVHDLGFVVGDAAAVSLQDLGDHGRCVPFCLCGRPSSGGSGRSAGGWLEVGWWVIGLASGSDGAREKQTRGARARLREPFHGHPAGCSPARVRAPGFRRRQCPARRGGLNHTTPSGSSAVFARKGPIEPQPVEDRRLSQLNFSLHHR